MTDLAPLFQLRVRTPRLELRLPTQEELEQLREVAAAGIHPPEFMPFSVAWTDDPELAGFLPYHELRRREWSVAAWHLELGVWLEGSPVGVQAVTAEDFPRTRTVMTGSWLGARFQGRGVGTEMRTAVLELAFRGLGAEVARSGAIDGNAASLRVSEKLGYRHIGRSTVAPRGEEVGHADLESAATSGALHSRSRSRGSSPACRSSAFPRERAEVHAERSASRRRSTRSATP